MDDAGADAKMFRNLGDTHEVLCPAPGYHAGSVRRPCDGSGLRTIVRTCIVLSAHDRAQKNRPRRVR
jgi:hypothetical protein